MAQAEWDGWPDGMEMIRQVREAAGLFAGAMPITPKQAWEEAIDVVRRLRQGQCHACIARDELRPPWSRAGEGGS